MSQRQSWHVDRLVLENFRRYEHLTIDLSRDVTLLIGENGSGKTAVLDAIAVMLSLPVKELGGDPRGFKVEDARLTPDDLDSARRTATIEPSFPVHGWIEAVLEENSYSWETKLSSARGRTTRTGSDAQDFARDLSRSALEMSEHGEIHPILPVIASYGVDRLLTTGKAKNSHGTSRLATYETALDARSDLKRSSPFVSSLFQQVLAAQAYGDEYPTAARRQFEAIERACTIVLEPVGWSRLRWNPLIDGLTLFHPDHGTLPLDRMAAGTRIAAGLTIDLASRMARANPGLGAAELLTQTPGIVLVDEIDLHLHPIWQQRIVPSLREAFPRVQFILTTHSPQVISTVEPENIRILTERGIVIPEHSIGLRSNVVLQKLQGVDPAPAVPVRKQLDEYLDLVDAGEGHGQLAHKLRADLDRSMGGAEMNEELVRADAYLSFSRLGE